MSSKPKEVYKSFKRSLSLATSSTLALSSSSSSIGVSSPTANGARYHGGSNSKHWIHPPDVLNHGRVEYSVKLLGQTEVAAAKGTEVIRDAIQKIRFGLQVNRSITGHSGSKLQKVDIQINVDGLNIVDSKSKMVLYKYPLHRISFCADDKQDKRVFSFIAKADNLQRHDCFVFLSDKLAEQITLTIGEAFDLAYQKFINNKGRDLENTRQTILLRKKIAELEAENAKLKDQLAGYYRNSSRSNGTSTTSHSWEQFNAAAAAAASITPPQLPTSPIPIGPPPGLSPKKTSSSSLPRHDTPNASVMADICRNGPDIGRRLENLQLDRLEDLFDDSFDPRADERRQQALADAAAAAAKRDKDLFDLDPFDTSFANDLLSSTTTATASSPSNGNNHRVSSDEHQPTAADFERMISKVDAKLAEMHDGFKHGLSIGDTGTTITTDELEQNDV